MMIFFIIIEIGIRSIGNESEKVKRRERVLKS